MALTLISGPDTEPVSVAAAKAHLRVDAADEDGLIASLITTARLQVEAAFGLALTAQTWALSIARRPRGGCVVLPLRPVRRVNQVSLRAANGRTMRVEPAHYDVDLTGEVARITARSGAWWPAGDDCNGLDIEFVAGFGNQADDVPGNIRQAVMLLVAHWFEHRDPSTAGMTATPMPASVSGLLAPYKAVRL